MAHASQASQTRFGQCRCAPCDLERCTRGTRWAPHTGTRPPPTHPAGAAQPQARWAYLIICLHKCNADCPPGMGPHRLGGRTGAARQPTWQRRRRQQRRRRRRGMIPFVENVRKRATVEKVDEWQCAVRSARPWVAALRVSRWRRSNGRGPCARSLDSRAPRRAEREPAAPQARCVCGSALSAQRSRRALGGAEGAAPAAPQRTSRLGTTW